MSIATPEGLHLDLVLAGVGSRFIAALLDGLLRLAILVAATVLVSVSGGGDGVLVAVMTVTIFLVFFGYDVVFEVLAGGRTPGKRWTGLRVVAISGAAVGVGASVVRNLLRLVDALPGMYLVGIVVAGVTERHQRVGDLVAGTLVVRESHERATAPAPTAPDRERGTTSGRDELGAWDVSAISVEEIATVNRFLERRHGLDPDARRRIARELATRLRPRVVGPGERPSPERFLEDLVAAKSLRT